MDWRFSCKPQINGSRAGWAQWWERSPSTNVSRVWFPDPTSYVGWVRWFSTLLQEVFLRELRFCPLLTKPTFDLIWFDLFDLQSLQLVQPSCLARMIWHSNKVIIIITINIIIIIIIIIIIMSTKGSSNPVSIYTLDQPFMDTWSTSWSWTTSILNQYLIDILIDTLLTL